MTTSALTVLGAIAIAVVSAHPQQQGTGVPTTFDVASVRQNQDRSARTMIDLRGLRGGTLTLRAVTLGEAIRLSQGWGGRDVLNYQVFGGPSWINEATFDIVAKFEAGTEGPANPALPPRVAQMLRNLLAERFALRVREELRDVPIFALVPAHGDGRRGPSIAPSTTVCEPAAADPREGRCVLQSGPQGLSGRGVDLDQLVKMLRFVRGVGRPVVDHTGWTGLFDFSLNFPQLLDPLSNPGAITVFQALEDQLGLKLEPRTAPYRVFVVDGADMPSAN